jgi:hypothetical protein
MEAHSSEHGEREGEAGGRREPLCMNGPTPENGKQKIVTTGHGRYIEACSSEHGEREGEAPRASLVEGATRAPIIRGAFLALLLLPLILSHALCARQCPADSAARNQTSQKTLRLVSKNPATWKIVPHGAKGVLSFNENTGHFAFTAENLRPLKEYSLVRHNAGETSGDLLAKGIADQTGALSLTGTWRLWGGKVWLLPTDHTSQSSGRLRLITWRPKEILFEEKVLGVVYPCSNKK